MKIDVLKYREVVEDLIGTLSKKTPIPGSVPVVRVENCGRIGWHFEKDGVGVDNLITLADGKTKAKVIEIFDWESVYKVSKTI